MSKTTIGVLVFSLITVICWIGSDIYHAEKDVDYPAKYKNIEKIEDYFDIELLEKVDSKRDYNLYNPFKITE